MRQRKNEREPKRQKGQYMTPPSLVHEVLSRIRLEDYTHILEPSCGDGAFLSAIADRLTNDHSIAENPATPEIVGIELDPLLAHRTRTLMARTNEASNKCFQADIYEADFFRSYLTRMLPSESGGSKPFLYQSYDLIIGNPPFGGTFDPGLEDALDHSLGRRLGKKIKKETYAFFIVACLDLLSPGGRMVFVCSDTLLTIRTMEGLRQLLMENGEVEIREVHDFSEETSYPMIIIDFKKDGKRGLVTRNATVISEQVIRATPHLSWGSRPEFARLFDGPLLGDYCVASSGMTTGKNALFVRKVDGHTQISEPFHFEFYEASITVEYERERARLGKLATRRTNVLEQAESQGKTERRLRTMRLNEPLVIQIPDEKYRPYNKANSRLIFSEPTHYIFWENNGEAVLTYKKTGNWYLRGVGGLPYFGREGITWPLVASRFIPRYLPSGYILDSGSPCAFRREGIDRDELFYILGWLLSPLANRVLKTVINHTRNIQSKDFERMPYPWWKSGSEKAEIVAIVKGMIAEASEGRTWAWNDGKVQQLGAMFNLELEAGRALPPTVYSSRGVGAHQEPLFRL